MHKGYAELRAYKPFINPAAMYLSGLYFLNTADSNRSAASYDFKAVRGIIGPSTLLDKDMALAKQTARLNSQNLGGV